MDSISVLWADSFHAVDHIATFRKRTYVETQRRLAQMFQKLPYFFKIESPVQLMLQRPKPAGPF